MLSIKFIRENAELVQTCAKNKNTDVNVPAIVALDEERRKNTAEVEGLKSERNRVSQEIAQKKRSKENADAQIAAMKDVSARIKALDKNLKEVEAELNRRLLTVPNVYHESVPIGADESDNAFVSDWGEKIEHDFAAKDQFELAESLGLINFKAGAAMTGSGFLMYTAKGARLERSLINFMLDLHTSKHGYEELFPPFLVNPDSATTTGQLPKFAEDMFQIGEDNLYAIPTAEVPITNIHRDEIMAEANLSKKYSAYSACFRREAGSYGKDTRGLQRLHQFNKVELVKFTRPEDSYTELESLRADAEKVLQMLGLHYRIVALASGDLSFAAAKCYDIEVWAPVTAKYLEVSSCSNFEDFQARRGNIRYRRAADGKVQHVHTLNGSGVATPRLMIALLETWQQADGSIKIPEVLHKYTCFSEIR